MFSFVSEDNANMYNTLSFLVKRNNGQFKSYKQAQFLTKTLRRERNFDTKDSVFKNFGVEITDTQYIATIDAYTQWADYGHDSVRPVSWLFVMDDQGVVSQHKLVFMGTMRKGTSPDPSKTKLLWKREGELTPLEVPAQEPVVHSKFIGQPGERIVFKGVVKSVFTFDRQKFHYYDSGVGYITKIDVDGNDVIYFGELAEKNATVEFKATVKAHNVRDGRNQTIIARPKVSNA